MQRHSRWRRGPNLRARLISLRIGVDVGGTFTDFVAWSQDRGWLRLKQPTSRPDPSEGIFAGLQSLLGPHSPSWQIGHGTTAATNTALEGSGPEIAFITTAGFGDILSLGRGERLDLYAIQAPPRASLVRPENCFEVRERLDSQGRILIPLQNQECQQLAQALSQRGIVQVAVCLLFSYLNPQHELQLSAILESYGLQVTLSHQVDPQPKEYERASTTVMQAYVSPSLDRYLERLEAQLQDCQLWIVRSSGSVCRPAEAIQRAVGCLLSGPAAGLSGAWQLAQRLQLPRILTLDVGGTSSDVALCDGDLPFLEQSEVGGIPFRCPQVDIHTVGAGGGSIAYRDSTGLLRVGPQSAGSRPGPAAYGRGGPVTVSDALLYLGRLPQHLAGGNLKLDSQASAQALEALAGQLQLDPMETAAAIVEIIEQTMAQALRFISLERGHDPRKFVLVAFGGGGGSHAAALARHLGVRRVLIPERPGLLCAEGALVAPWESQCQRSWCQAWTPELQRQLEGWHQQQRKALRGKAPVGRLSWQLFCEMRYQGQGTSLWLKAGSRLEGRFQRLHRQRFGYDRPEHALELVSSLLRAHLPRPLDAQAARPADAPRSKLNRNLQRGYWGLPPRPMEVQVVEELEEGSWWPGPLRVDRLDGTIWVPPGWRICQENGNLWLESLEHEEEHVK